ncbi:MAG: hypothetical protein V4850_08930 [Myxococcota bacterium]
MLSVLLLFACGRLTEILTPAPALVCSSDTDPLAQAFPLGARVVTRSAKGAVAVRGADLEVDRMLLPSGAAVIGHAGEDLLVAFADGRTAALDSSGTLVFGPSVAGVPAWIGESGGRRLAVGLRAPPVVERPAPSPPDAGIVTENALGLGPVDLSEVVLDLVDLTDGSHRSVTMALRKQYGNLEVPSAVLATDEALYIGWDWGEFGGGYARVDLADVSARAVPGAPIYGFARVADEVWMHGGTMHMGMLLTNIATADDPQRGLYAASNYDKPPPPGPVLPITHIVEGPGDALTVLAYSDIWRADRALARWDKVDMLDLRYEPGRPDAVGTYPAVTAAWRDAQGRLVLATRGNGMCVLDPP